MNADCRPVAPPPFPPDYRASSLLLHVASLPSPYGIGDVGPAALAWIDRLREAGQTWWQALPLGPTGYGNSPYQALSSFAGNELLISPDGLIEDGLLQASDCEPKSFAASRIDYGAVIPYKRRLLETAWGNFCVEKNHELRTAYQQFCDTHQHWLEDYALFRALKPEITTPITSSGPESWSAAFPRLWRVCAKGWRARSIRFVSPNSCCSARRNG
jgi:4-alpha-glucanotransferase